MNLKHISMQLAAQGSTPIITRFAPSPTGALHIGGARTALFNYLFAKSQQGKFLLRVEDTDKLRSSKEALETIIDGLKWLGLSWDGEIVFQSQNAARHLQVANLLLGQGNAYYCFKEGKKINAQEKKQGELRPTIRFKAKDIGKTIINDLVQGKVTVENSTLEDVVLIKSDGSPTYMLACVCDDHDMGISHVIRGSDHLTNSFTQVQIYEAMKWPIPQMAHIPLIHGPDGQKLSKRHGATGLLEYREAGYLPDAICNYLVKLGWSCGDKELFSREEMQKAFDVKDINRAPAMLDFAKLQSLNSHYIKLASDSFLSARVIDGLQKKGCKVTHTSAELIEKALPELKLRSKTLKQLEQDSFFLLMEERLYYSKEATEIIAKTGLLHPLLEHLESQDDFSRDSLKEALEGFAAKFGLESKDVTSLLRALITGSSHSPSIYSLASILGRELVCKRIREALNA